MSDNEEINEDKEKEYKDPRVGETYPRNHISHCKICQGGDRLEIERKYQNWEASGKQLAKDYDLDEYTMGRHIRYFHLKEKRALKAMPLLDSLLDLSYEAFNPGKCRPQDLLAMLKMKKELQGNIEGDPEEQLAEEVSKMNTPELRDTLRKLNVHIDGLTDKEG